MYLVKSSHEKSVPDNSKSLIQKFPTTFVWITYYPTLEEANTAADYLRTIAFEDETVVVEEVGCEQITQESHSEGRKLQEEVAEKKS